jgi:adenylate cyclase
MRLPYTGMGDTINLAPRLEGMTKVYGTTILIFKQMTDAASNLSRGRWARVQVERRAEPVTLYELVKSGSWEISAAAAG